VADHTAGVGGVFEELNAGVMQRNRFVGWDWPLIGVLLLCGVFVVVMCGVVVYGWNNEYNEYRLRRIGVETRATVVDTSTKTHVSGGRRGSSGSFHATIYYRFLHDAKYYKGSAGVRLRAIWQHPPGTIIRVRYLPLEPDISSPVGLKSITMMAIERIALVAATGALMAGFGYVFWPRKWRRQGKIANSSPCSTRI
jgi:hypothetical protein